MVRPIVMPKMGQSEEEGKIVRWVKREGEVVHKGDVLFEIETDKAVLEVESFFDGTLLKVLVPEGQIAAVQSAVAYMGEPGEAIPDDVHPSAGNPSATPTEGKDGSPGASLPPKTGVVETKPQALVSPVKVQPSTAIPLQSKPQESAAPPRTKVSPRAAKLARESAISSARISGSGPGGRVVERDVKKFLEIQNYSALRITPSAKALAIEEKVDILQVRRRNSSSQISIDDIRSAIDERPKAMSRIRQIIAERLTESVTTAPHFFVTVMVDMTDLVQFRSQLKKEGKPYKVTDFIMMAVTQSLKEFPVLNSATDGRSTWWHSSVDLGLAVNLENGLVVPVLRDADRMSLLEMHNVAAELADKARTGKLKPDEMMGSTFTISNMGMLGVENFTAIINPGEGAILAVSSTMKQPTVKDGMIVIRDVMKMTLSSDHRIIDGATAAQFVNAVKSKLEEISLWKRLT